MAKLKSRKHDGPVQEFLNRVEDKQKQEDSYQILKMMQEITGEDPKMWGSSMVGFGSYHYKYESGREGDWFMTGFSPRKQNLALYIIPGFNRHPELMEMLGKYKTGKSCLYINKLEDVDEQVLRELITQSVAYLKQQYE